ncbi:MAG: hypothetical protein ABEJ74_06935 [Haloferacaceae archaeon]
MIERDRRLGALLRAVGATSAVLAGTLLLGIGIHRLVVSVAGPSGAEGTSALAALTVGALLPPLSFVALRRGHASRAGARTLVGGLAVVGTSLAALWLTSPPLDPPSATAVGIAVTYAVGLGLLATSHLAALLVHEFTVPARARPSTPSYRRSDEEYPLPSDGGTAGEELTFPLDSDPDDGDASSSRPDEPP